MQNKLFAKAYNPRQNRDERIVTMLSKCCSRLSKSVFSYYTQLTPSLEKKVLVLLFLQLTP